MADQQELRVGTRPEEETRELFPEESEEGARRERARSYFRQRPRAKWVLLLVALVLGAIGFFLWRYYAVRESTDDAQIDGHIIPVSARISGKVTAVNFDINQLIQKGQVLVRLDPADYQVALDRARADLADAIHTAQAAHVGIPIVSTSTESSLAEAQANLAAAQKEVAAAEARVREAQANHTRAAQDLKRFQELVTKDEISRQQYDNAVTAELAARAAVEVAQASVASAQSHVAQAQAQVQAASTAPQQVAVTRSRAGAASAQVEKDQAAVKQAELNLEYTTISAPVTGVANNRNVEPGQYVQPGQPLVAITDLEELWVTANFKETQLKDMRLGQPASVHVDAYNQDFRGHVDSIGGATGARMSLLPPENATGNFVKVVQRIPVKIVLDQAQDVKNLRPGMSVEATVMTNR